MHQVSFKRDKAVSQKKHLPRHGLEAMSLFAYTYMCVAAQFLCFAYVGGALEYFVLVVTACVVLSCYALRIVSSVPLQVLILALIFGLCIISIYALSSAPDSRNGREITTHFLFIWIMPLFLSFVIFFGREKSGAERGPKKGSGVESQ